MFQPMYENVFNRLCKDKTLANIDVELKKKAYHKAIETDLKYIDDPEYYDNYSWAVSQYASKAEEAQDLFNRISSYVKLDNICFRYNNSNFCLKNLNLEIYPGEKVAIVGENGVGKSTLVKLLMRFYDVDSGTISINGIDLKKYDLDSLRKRIGVAFQQTNIYALSLADNINVYGTEWNNSIQNAIIKTGLDKVIIKNDANLETELTREFDDSGIMLSGGEVQKIGIARLLSKEFGLLIFDEPSSALDPLAEYEMSKLILDSSNNATTIVIAHRLSTIRNVDRIILIDDGQVKEAGSHEELMSYKGKYYEMFTKQAENYQFFDVTADRNFTLH